jgi:hypothetical protein
MEQSTFLTERIEDTERIQNEVNRSFEDYMNKLRKKSKDDILKTYIHTEDDSIEEWMKVNDKTINIHLDAQEELTKITSTLETLNHNFNNNIRKMKNELKSLENKRKMEYAMYERERLQRESRAKGLQKQKHSEPSKYEEYNKQYAKQKNKEMKHCDVCDDDVSYYCWSKHQRTLKHLKNKM